MTGTCILVNGNIVAWFADFTEEAREWCTENYFGQWLTWRATAPEIIPLTADEEAEVKQRADELYNKLNIV